VVRGNNRSLRLEMIKLVVPAIPHQSPLVLGGCATWPERVISAAEELMEYVVTENLVELGDPDKWSVSSLPTCVDQSVAFNECPSGEDVAKGQDKLNLLVNKFIDSYRCPDVNKSNVLCKGASCSCFQRPEASVYPSGKMDIKVFPSCTHHGRTLYSSFNFNDESCAGEGTVKT
jgi:hypothetical protein